MSQEISDWPFEAARNTACFASRHIFSGDRIHFVYHDWEDGCWQFLPDRDMLDGDCILVCLEEVFRLDSTIGSLADLPEGWRAVRQKSGGWSRERFDPYPSYSDDGYYLIPVASYSSHYPEVPSEEARRNIQPGCFVKLVFRFAAPETEARDYDAERMWVIVEEIDSENGVLRGRLDNDPKYGKALNLGDMVTFNQLHILAIDHNQ